MNDLARFLAFHETEEALKQGKIKRKDRMKHFKARFRFHVNEMFEEAYRGVK